MRDRRTYLLQLNYLKPKKKQPFVSKSHKKLSKYYKPKFSHSIIVFTNTTISFVDMLLMCVYKGNIKAFLFWRLPKLLFDYLSKFCRYESGELRPAITKSFM